MAGGLCLLMESDMADSEHPLHGLGDAFGDEEHVGRAVAVGQCGDAAVVNVEEFVVSCEFRLQDGFFAQRQPGGPDGVGGRFAFYAAESGSGGILTKSSG